MNNNPIAPERIEALKALWEKAGSAQSDDTLTASQKRFATYEFAVAWCNEFPSILAALEADRWRDVREELPENHRRVLVTIEFESGKRMVEMAYYVRPKTVEATIDDEPQEYDSETDTDWLKPGWYEFSHTAEIHYLISEKVISWCLPPVPPKEAP